MKTDIVNIAGIRLDENHPLVVLNDAECQSNDNIIPISVMKGNSTFIYQFNDNVTATVVIQHINPDELELTCRIVTPNPQRVPMSFPNWTVALDQKDTVDTLDLFRSTGIYFENDGKVESQPFLYLHKHAGGFVMYPLWPEFKHTPETVHTPCRLNIIRSNEAGKVCIRLIWKGYTWKKTNEGYVWESSPVRIRAASGIENALAMYEKDSNTGPYYEDKLNAWPAMSEKFKTHLFLKWIGSYDQMARDLDRLTWDDAPLPINLHLAVIGDEFDHRYPEFLPASISKGGQAGLENLYKAAHERGMIVGPYTNHTWFGDTSPFDNDPNMPTKANRSKQLESLVKKWAAEGKGHYAAMAKRDKSVMLEDLCKTDMYWEWYPDTISGKLHHFGWRMSPWHPDLIATAETLYRQLAGRDDAMGHYPSDYLFLDQIQARTCFPGPFADYDFNNDEGIMDRYTPYGLQDGLDHLAQRAGQYAPTVIEGHGVSSMPYAVQFCGLWALRELKQRLAEGLPLFGQDRILACNHIRFYHRYVSLSDHNLENNIPVGDFLALSLHLGLGLKLQTDGMPYVGNLEQYPEFIHWVQFLSMLQKHIASRYEGVAMTEPKQLDGNCYETRFDGLCVVCNAKESPHKMNDQITIAPNGFYASTTDGLEAGCFDDYRGRKRKDIQPPLCIIRNKDNTMVFEAGQ